MSKMIPSIRIHYVVFTMLWLLLAGCVGTGGGGQVHGSVYVGVGYNDPWYWGPGYAVPPPGMGPPPRPPHPSDRPKPSHPITKIPPPRPAAMPRGGRR